MYYTNVYYWTPKKGIRFLVLVSIIMLHLLNGVSCKPTTSKPERVKRTVVEEETVQDSDVRLETLIKATEAVQEFQKLLNEQMLNSDSSNANDNAQATLPPLVHSKHRHSKHKKPKKEPPPLDVDAVPSMTASPPLPLSADEFYAETERRFNPPSNVHVTPYECPRINGKSTQLLCPSRRRHGYHVCIDETSLCNGVDDCPNGEDENAVNCMFYKMTMRYFKTVVDQVVELSEHVVHGSTRRNGEEL